MSETQEPGKFRQYLKLGMEFVGLAAIIVYTVFSILQWAQIRWTNRLTREALNSNGQALQATLGEMQGQVNATNRVGSAAEIANGNSLAADRPWIGIVITVADWEVNKTPVATVYFLNSGRRPAEVIGTRFDSHDYESLPANPNYHSYPTDVRGSGLILPTANMSNSATYPVLTQERLNELALRKTKFFIYATIDYRDVRTGAVHWTHGCIQFLPGFNNVGHGFVNCSTYNNIDSK